MLDSILHAYSTSHEISTRISTTKAKLLVFVTPLLFLIFALATFVIEPVIYQKLFGILEGGFFEWIQFLCYVMLCYVIAFILSLFTFIIFKNRF